MMNVSYKSIFTVSIILFALMLVAILVGKSNPVSPNYLGEKTPTTYYQGTADKDASCGIAGIEKTASSKKVNAEIIADGSMYTNHFAG